MKHNDNDITLNDHHLVHFIGGVVPSQHDHQHQSTPRSGRGSGCVRFGAAVSLSTSCEGLRHREASADAAANVGSAWCDLGADGGCAGGD